MEEAPLDVRLLGKEFFCAWTSQQQGAGLWSQRTCSHTHCSGALGPLVGRVMQISCTYRDKERELGD